MSDNERAGSHQRSSTKKRKKDFFLFVFSFLNGQQSFDIFVSRPQELKAGVQAEEEQMLEYVGLVNTLLLQTRK